MLLERYRRFSRARSFEWASDVLGKILNVYALKMGNQIEYFDKGEITVSIYHLMSGAEVNIGRLSYLTHLQQAEVRVFSNPGIYIKKLTPIPRIKGWFSIKKRRQQCKLPLGQ